MRKYDYHIVGCSNEDLETYTGSVVANSPKDACLKGLANKFGDPVDGEDPYDQLEEWSGDIQSLRDTVEAHDNSIWAMEVTVSDGLVFNITVAPNPMTISDLAGSVSDLN